MTISNAALVAAGSHSHQRSISSAWIGERSVHYIESSGSLPNFGKATAYAEGYAQALVDSQHIDVSTERDLLIIETVDEWRTRFLSTFFAHA